MRFHLQNIFMQSSFKNFQDMYFYLEFLLSNPSFHCIQLQLSDTGHDVIKLEHSPSLQVCAPQGTEQRQTRTSTELIFKLNAGWERAFQLQSQPCINSCFQKEGQFCQEMEVQKAKIQITELFLDWLVVSDNQHFVRKKGVHRSQQKHV